MMDFMDMAATCAPNVHISTLSSILRHESRLNPFAIGLNGGGKLQRQPRNKAEAVSIAEQLKKQGHDFDSGLGQVNIRNLPALNMRISDLFDPCANLRGTAKVLEDCYKRATNRYGEGQTALKAALSCYNTGNFSSGFTNGYVQKVSAQAVLKVPALLPDDKGESSPQPLSKTPSVSQEATQKGKGTDIADAFQKKQGDIFISAV